MCDLTVLIREVLIWPVQEPLKRRKGLVIPRDFDNFVFLL